MFQDKLTKEIAAAAAQIKTEPTKNVVNGNSVEGAVVSIMANEELKGNQHKIDANKNGKVDAHDFKLLRSKKKVEEGVKGAGVGAALGSVAGGPVGAAIGGALGHVAGEVLSSAKNKAKAMGRIAVGPSMADSKLKREDVEQIDEVGDTSAGRKMISSYVNKAIGDKSKDRSKGLRKATSRLYKDNYYGKKNEEVEMNEEDAYNKDRYAVKDGKAKKDNPTHMGSPNYKDQPHHVWATSAEHALKKSMKKEEVEQMDEAFPTVADAKKRMAAGQSSFEKKKISTGTVYSRKYKAEPDDADDMPKKKAKTMKEMLDIYRQHGAESLVENLMIEEPTNDEYKKEAEIAQAKSEGKIRNDKQIAKAASQGVKMEEVELEMYDADEINGVQIDTIDERSMTDAEMDKREKIVKSMKKGIQGFKDRYGDDAKSVMYATATKNAMKD
jgi:outer membrane lipoprotein SlyB